MSYRVTYPSSNRKTVTCRRIRFSKKKWGTVIGILLTAVLIFGVFSDRFLPGDRAVTSQALSNLVSSLREGDGIGEAMTVFCREIFRGAGVYGV